MNPTNTRQDLRGFDRKVLLGFVLIFLFISFSFTLFFIFRTVNPPERTHSSITPTRFILHNAIKSVSPTNKSINVSLYASVSATFINPVADLKGISISLKPQTSGDISWTPNNTTITFSPNESFTPSKAYEATLVFPSGKQVWQFTVVSSEKVSNQDALRNQVESDIETAESLKKFYEDYPWWERFPLKKEGYFVYFHPEKKSFVGLLYPKKGQQSAVDEEVRNMKNEIETTIKSYNIDLSDYGIEWKITPEP